MLCLLVGRHENVGTMKLVGSSGNFVNSCRACDYYGDSLENLCEKGLVFTLNHFDYDGFITRGLFLSHCCQSNKGK